MHTHHRVQNENQGWRGNWFVKNILAELPIIGAFFHTREIPHMLHHAGKSASMLIGGAIGMMLEPIETEKNDDLALRMTKTTTNMAIGMSLGNMTYNSIYSLGNTLYYRLKKTREQEQTRPLLVNDNTATTTQKENKRLT